jgi:hypothetical protein
MGEQVKKWGPQPQLSSEWIQTTGGIVLSLHFKNRLTSVALLENIEKTRMPHGSLVSIQLICASGGYITTGKFRKLQKAMQAFFNLLLVT